jgi:hypothetical protein
MPRRRRPRRVESIWKTLFANRPVLLNPTGRVARARPPRRRVGERPRGGPSSPDRCTCGLSGECSTVAGVDHNTGLAGSGRTSSPTCAQSSPHLRSVHWADIVRIAVQPPHRNELLFRYLDRWYDTRAHRPVDFSRPVGVVLFLPAARHRVGGVQRTMVGVLATGACESKHVGSSARFEDVLLHRGGPVYESDGLGTNR